MVTSPKDRETLFGIVLYVSKKSAFNAFMRKAFVLWHNC